MRPGKYDKFLLIFLTIVFLYSFFSMEVIEVKEGFEVGKKKYVMPTALIITPPLILFIFFVMINEKKLKNISIRILIIKAIIFLKQKIKRRKK